MARSLVKRCCAVAAAVAAAGLFGAAPAAGATADEVKIISLPDSFQAGGPGGVITVSVTRRQEECVRLAGMTVVTLQGMQYGHLRIELGIDGGWQNSPISHSDGDRYFGQDIGVEPEFLCPGQTRTMRHRITFLTGAPAGQATIVPIVFEHGGPEMGRDQAIRPVGRAAAPPPVRTNTPPATSRSSVAPETTPARPTTPVASTRAPEPTASGATALAGLTSTDSVNPAGGAIRTILAGGVLGVGSLAGLGLCVLLLLRHRRGDRSGRADRGGTGFPAGPERPGDLGPTVELPTLRP